MDGSDRVMLLGADVVAYYTLNNYAQGKHNPFGPSARPLIFTLQTLNTKPCLINRLFGGEVSQKAFALELDKNIALGDQYWKNKTQGSNSFLQRSKLLLLRVPHYKTGE